MIETGICVCCEREFIRNPRVKNQQYCGAKACQQARRREWQRRKLQEDEAYRQNQARCLEQWQKRNPGYSKSYRATHPEYEARNRALQFMRDNRRKIRQNSADRGVVHLAKMDSLLAPYYRRRGCRFRLYVQGGSNLAKMDALEVRLVPI